MKKSKVAILVGGDSEERVISEMSASTVFQNMDLSVFDPRLIDIQGNDWKDVATGAQIDKNDFSLILDSAHWRPDVIFCAIHGSPLENGQLQGYFDTLKIPYTCCDGFTSALTMNKYATKKLLHSLDLPLAEDLLFQHASRPDDAVVPLMVEKLGLPMFIKPNKHGSSFGVTKVKTAGEVMQAINYAFEFDDEVLCEQYISGREFGNGVYQYLGKTVALPPTEIIPKTDFFDYAAKYEGASTEVTPADLSTTQTTKIQQTAMQIYDRLHLSGFVRIDFILHEDQFYLLEVNTVPGLSPASIVPQQANAAGFTLTEFFRLVIEEAMAATEAM
jgi:D-alanine-D-alanine ligase